MRATILRTFSRLRQDWLLGSPNLLLNGHRRYLAGVEPPGRDADHSSPRSVYDEIKCSQTSCGAYGGGERCAQSSGWET